VEILKQFNMKVQNKINMDKQVSGRIEMQRKSTLKAGNKMTIDELTQAYLNEIKKSNQRDYWDKMMKINQGN